jgi:hypothetical protein
MLGVLYIQTLSLYYIYIHTMLDLIKKLVIFAIGFYFILFFARTFLGGVSATGFAKDISGALGEFRKLGQMGSSTNSGFGWGGPSGSNSAQNPTGQTTSSKGSDGAVVFVNLSRGNMVSPGQNILGNMRGDWFYEGVATARFLDEYGKQIGMTQVVAESNTNVKTQVPFSVVARFTQGGSQAGYLVIEKANTTGDKKKDAWVTIPITYPVAAGYNQPTNTNSNTGTQNTSGSVWASPTSPSVTNINTNTSGSQNTTNTNTNFGGNTLPAPR